MAEKLAFKDGAAAEYDRAFAHVTAYFMPFLLRAAHIAPGMHVLDIATGTGLSAEAAVAAVGPTGHVIAADLSPAMAEKGAWASWQSTECFSLYGWAGAFVGARDDEGARKYAKAPWSDRR
jgi:protein-L-isoaspartate O-methyltransferase